MTLYLRFVAVALIVQISSPILFASGASGWVEENCSGAMFHIRENTHAFPLRGALRAYLVPLK
jgi:hypothetical protein